MINGQEKLISTIDSFNKLPHSILLLGEVGSGHVEVCEYMAEKFNLQIYELTDFISTEFIDEILTSTTPSLYYINLSKIGVREQNIILKMYEEPNPLSYIVINCESDDAVIDTIKSRSYILTMSRYTPDQLKPLIDKDEELVLRICTTPGQVELANHTDLPKLFNLCETIMTALSTANYQNTLSISNMINFKDEYSKYDLLLFIKALKWTILNNNFKYGGKIYAALIKTSKKIDSMVNKQQYFENFLTNIWLIVRS